MKFLPVFQISVKVVQKLVINSLKSNIVLQLEKKKTSSCFWDFSKHFVMPDYRPKILNLRLSYLILILKKQPGIHPFSVNNILKYYL